jgi:hypothetical protein
MAVFDLACTQDAIIASPDLGAGQDKHNVAGAEGGRTLWSLLKFEALPSGVTVNNLSTAKLYMTRAPSGAHDSPNNGAAIRIQRITASWQEGDKGGGSTEIYSASNAVDYANKPAVTDTGQTASGGSQPSSDETQWSVSMKDIVLAWLGGSGYHGVAVRAHNDTADICFWARHHATTSKRPFLRIETTGGGSTGANTKPAAPTVVVQV